MYFSTYRKDKEMIKKVKELWVRVDNQHDYQQKISKIQEIIGASSRIDEIFIYMSDTRSIKRMHENASITEQMIDDLNSFLGSDNVKLVEKEEVSYDYMIDEFSKCPGANSLESLEFMKIRQLERIGDALEDIVTKLSALDDLEECIGTRPPSAYHRPGALPTRFLRVGGEISTD